jgi:hypothetical protein
MLIKEHLQLMTYAKKEGKSVLIISDTSKYVSDRRGKEISQESSLYEINMKQNLPSIKEQKNWHWELAPLGEISSNYSLKLLVNAIKVLAFFSESLNRPPRGKEPESHIICYD